MKKWISLGVLAVLAVVSRGIILGLFLLVPMADIFIAVNRDRRYRWTPWPLTRRVFRLLFVSPPRAPAVVYMPPGAPVGERNSRVIPQDVKVAVAVRDGGRCRLCGSQEELHYDHIIPWSRGGANTVGNIQLLCGDCNRRKSASMPDELI